MEYDIHLWVERWADYWRFVNPYQKANEGGASFNYWDAFFMGRNSTLFSVLSGVQQTSNLIPTIARPRGIPPDISDIGANLCEKYRDVARHHSWLTALELMAYNWSYEIEVPGMLFNRKVPIKELCSDFVEDFMPELLNYGDPKTVRVVFFFVD